MRELGVTEDNFKSFILDVYNRCKDDGLSSEEFAELLMDMIEFSKANALRLSQISEHIRQKGDEKNKLERNIQDLRAQLKTLEDEKVASYQRRSSALDKERMTSTQIESYMFLKEELIGLGCTYA